jgi:hypothetical protein
LAQFLLGPTFVISFVFIAYDCSVLACSLGCRGRDR